MKCAHARNALNIFSKEKVVFVSKYSLSFKSAADILKYIAEHEVQFIDFSFTDIHGAWRHTTQHASGFNKAMIDKGIIFDGSSVPGWREIHESDMILKPDIGRSTYDPFAAQKTIKIICDVYDPRTNTPYVRDPRSIAKAAEKYLTKSSVADTAFIGPELEFFVFEDAKVNIESNHVSYHLDGEEGPYNKGRDYPTGNMGHRAASKASYFSESPIDNLSDIRSEMLTVIETMGVAVEKHHHEVAPSQCEVGITYSSLLRSADNLQICKHAVRNVAHSYGKTATFMAKPLNEENGSGLHMHLSLWKSGKPLFGGAAYANLSETALYFIGGVLKHARALNAFTNPTTNSYKRLVRGYEAPTYNTYSESNRSAACRIPYVHSNKESRAEFRFPDPTTNPYLCFAAVLMAGLDGIENKMHPGDATDKDIYQVPGNEVDKTSCLCSSLEESLHALKNDCDFLLKGDVFTKDFIDAYTALKNIEIARLKETVHPVEIDMYYSS